MGFSTGSPTLPPDGRAFEEGRAMDWSAGQCGSPRHRMAPMSLTSRERMRRAIASARDPRAPLPDRVPVMCQLALGHYFLQSGLSPFEVWYTSQGFAEALL